MTFSPNTTLYLALALYAAGTLQALASLFGHPTALRRGGLIAMIAGWVSHTVWIGTICSMTGHPPLTNLPETLSFVAWTVFAVELVLLLIYRVHAASFFVYPLVLILLTFAAVVREPFVRSEQALSHLFTAHLLLTTLGVAGLLVGVAFILLAYLQDRALKRKTRGRLWEWIPSLGVCRTLSYRAIATGFSVYTLGIVAGVLWSYRITATPIQPGAKQIGALTAWVLFAALLQTAMGSAFRPRRAMAISAAAMVAILVAILGIQHV